MRPLRLPSPALVSLFLVLLGIAPMYAVLTSPATASDNAPAINGAASAAPRALTDVAYVNDPNKYQFLDVHYPPGDGPFPALMFIHGGGWHSGSKDSAQRLQREFGDRYAIVSINYTLSGQAPWPAQGNDSSAALDYLMQHADQLRLQPDRIMIGGASAGATLASYVALTSEHQVRGVLHLAGSGDFRPNLQRERVRRSVLGLFGCPNAACLDPDELVDASPVSHVRPDGPPMFVQLGVRDTVIPHVEVYDFVAALRAAGQPVVFNRPEKTHPYVLDSELVRFVRSRLG